MTPASSTGHVSPRLSLGAPIDIAAPLTFLVGGLALWATSLGQIDPEQLDDLGLASILPWGTWVALVLLALGFALCLRQRPPYNQWLSLLHLAGLVLILHATPALAYGTLRYSWAWKHIGIVDFIQRHNNVDPSAPFLAVYHNWPGFFLLSARVAEFLRLDPLRLADLARFFPTAVNLLLIPVLLSVFRNFTSDQRLVWWSIWIFLAGNWVGQDYFSPQAVTFLLYLSVLALCLGPLAKPVPAKRTNTALSSFRAFCMKGLPSAEVPSARVGVLCSAAALLAVLAIVSSHQLTPVILAFALAGLALMGRVSIGYCCFLLVAEAFWLLHFANPFVSARLNEILAEFGNTVPAMYGQLADTGIASFGQVLVTVVCRALSLAIALMALIGGLRRLKAGIRDGLAVVLALAPLPLLLITSYGGEVLFRIYLFALPFLAFFAGAAIFPHPGQGRSVITTMLLTVIGVLLAAGFVVSNNGKDRQYRFSKAEVEAAHWLYKTAPPNSLLIEGARSYPSQFLNYENFTYLPISEEKPPELAEILEDPATVLGRWLDDPRWAAGFVIITESQKAIVDDLGAMPANSLQRVEDELLASARFKLVMATSDAKVFALNPYLREER